MAAGRAGSVLRRAAATHFHLLLAAQWPGEPAKGKGTLAGVDRASSCWVQLSVEMAMGPLLALCLGVLGGALVPPQTLF